MAIFFSKKSLGVVPHSTMPVGMHLVLARQVHPVGQRLDHLGLVVEGAVAVRVHEDGAGLRGKALEQPIGETRRGHLDAPLRGRARSIGLGQLLREGELLGPTGGRLFRIEASLLEQLLVPVEHHGGALERRAPGLAAGLTVFHEGREKALQPLLVVVALREVVEGNDRVVVDQREHVGGEDDGQRGRIAALVRGDQLDQGFLIGARIDRLHLDARILLLEVGRHRIDQLGDRPADGNGIVEGDFRCALRDGRLGDGGRTGDGGCAFQEFTSLHGLSPPCIAAS